METSKLTISTRHKLLGPSVEIHRSLNATDNIRHDGVSWTSLAAWSFSMNDSSSERSMPRQYSSTTTRSSSCWCMVTLKKNDLVLVRCSLYCMVYLFSTQASKFLLLLKVQRSRLTGDTGSARRSGLVAVSLIHFKERLVLGRTVDDSISLVGNFQRRLLTQKQVRLL